jgi:hypothetical protein
MKVITNYKHNYQEEPTRFFGFEDFESIAINCLLYVGVLPDSSIFQASALKKFLFCTEEQLNPHFPNNDPANTDQYLPYVDKLFTLCSPSVTKRFGRTNVFFPIHKKFILPPVPKINDIVYTGYADVSCIKELITRSFPKFNYRLVSYEGRIGLETDIGVTYIEKLRLIAQSRCSLVHNILGGDYSIGTPQLKSRTFEAAACRTLMLVLRDNYNVIEEWFIPNEDFVYFYDIESFERLIRDVSINYQSYVHIVENAFAKLVAEYTTESFVKKFIGIKTN